MFSYTNITEDTLYPTLLWKVFCSNTVRLKADHSGSAGYKAVIEVWFKDKWGAICNSNWGDKEADLVCHQMGFQSGKAVSMQLAYPMYPQQYSHIWLDNVNCSSQQGDSRLDHCSHGPWGTHSCMNDVASAECFPKCKYTVIRVVLLRDLKILKYFCVKGMSFTYTLDIVHYYLKAFDNWFAKYVLVFVHCYSAVPVPYDRSHVD